MEIKKVNDTFNMYTVKVSYGQLVALMNKLEDDHSGPVADEMYQALKWYIDHELPAPGEDNEDVKARKEDEKEESEETNTPPIPEPKNAPSEERLNSELPAPEEDFSEAK